MEVRIKHLLSFLFQSEALTLTGVVLFVLNKTQKVPLPTSAAGHINTLYTQKKVYVLNMTNEVSSVLLSPSHLAHSLCGVMAAQRSSLLLGHKNKLLSLKQFTPNKDKHCSFKITCLVVVQLRCATDTKQIAEKNVTNISGGGFNIYNLD